MIYKKLTSTEYSLVFYLLFLSNIALSSFINVHIIANNFAILTGYNFKCLNAILLIVVAMVSHLPGHLDHWNVTVLWNHCIVHLKDGWEKQEWFYFQKHLDFCWVLGLGRHCADGINITWGLQFIYAPLLVKGCFRNYYL